MGAMIAVVSKKGEDIVPHVINGLKALSHRGKDAHGIATHNRVLTARSIEDLTPKNLSGNIALGHNLSRLFSRDRPQPVLSKGFSVVFEGRFFPPPKSSEVNEMLNQIMLDPQRNAEQVVEKLDGSFVFAVASPSHILIGRDPTGTTPLYYGENKTIRVVASERKALWALKSKNIKSFPPGNLAKISFSSFSFKPISTITQPPNTLMDKKMATARLQDLLLTATKKRVSGVGKVAVAFSGGLDSSVIALLSKKCGKQVHLITVGLENQPEVQYARSAAIEFELPFHLQTYTVTDVEEALPRALWLIEDPNVINVSIAIPFYWIADTASRLGFDVVLAGQGSDELFGGYKRYQRKYTQSGRLEVKNAIFSDVSLAHIRNFQRDNQVFSFHGVELRLPFADFDVSNFSLGLPISLKIRSSKDHLRKRVLRHVARNIGAPLTIVNKNKKAIQYSTGVDKALSKLAKKESLTKHEYIMKVFLRVYRKFTSRNGKMTVS